MFINRALKWFIKAYIQAFAFCLSVALAIGFLMTFIAYPWEVLAAVVIGFFIVVAFLFFFGK